MRIARVQYASLPTPLVALERDGALYDVVELEQAWPERACTAAADGAADFATRVIALGLAGLEELDEGLRAGLRPTAARLEPDGVVWLPPCDTERAHWLHVGSAAARGAPHFRLESPRALVGHQGAVPVGSGEGELVATLGLALLLGEAIEDFAPQDAERAILGVSALLAWSVRGDDVGCIAAAQLGPVLVTPDELGELGALRGALVSGADTCRGVLLDGVPPLGEVLAYLAARVPLRAGDLVTLASARGPTSRGLGAPPGQRVEAHIERVGRLEGRGFRGAPVPPWPQDAAI